MEFIDKILNNYKLSSKDYILKYKSDHWGKSFLNFSKNVSNKKNLFNFRRNKILSLDLDDYGGFFQTTAALLKLVDVCGKKFIDDNSETKIGNPEEVYNVGDKDYNYNDLHNINNLFKFIFYTGSSFSHCRIFFRQNRQCRFNFISLIIGFLCYHRMYIWF